MAQIKSPFEITNGPEAPKRIVLLLWGAAAAGKTTFAATSPGKKLWLSLGDQEHVSLSHRKDWEAWNLYKETADTIFKHGQSDNPFGLDQYLSSHPEIGTVVLDSLTVLSAMALEHAIDSGVGRSRRGFVPTIEEPGQSAYGGRNAKVLKVVKGLSRIAAKHERHLVVTAHEADPKIIIQDGREIEGKISVMLGGQLVNGMTSHFSEIWYMKHEYGVRKLIVRAHGIHTPMKTRMFSGKGNALFVLKYDADEPDNARGQMTIAGWYKEWQKNGGMKIMPPAGPVRLSQTGASNAKPSER